MKKIIILAIFSILMIGGYGCMGIAFGGGDTNKRALEYMEKKYGEKFEYIGPAGGGYFTDVKTIAVSCESLPDRRIIVSIIKDEKGTRYYDNFKNYYFEAQVRDFILDIAKKYFDEVTFEVSISQLVKYPEDDITTTFEEYMNEDHTISGFMDINNTSEETMCEFFGELVRLGVHFSIDIDIPSTNAGYSADYLHSYTEYKFYRRH